VSLVRIPQYQLIIVASWQTLVRIDPEECLAFSSKWQTGPNLTKQRHDLLRVEPLLRHVQAPFSDHFLTTLGLKKPGQVNEA
jgi:hypothetical protein